MATVILILNITDDYSDTAESVQWSAGETASLGIVFAANGMEQTLRLTRLSFAGLSAGKVTIALNPGSTDFTAAFEATGRIIYEASDGDTLEVMIANADMTETYSWTPVNSDEVIAWAARIPSLADKSLILTFTDELFTTGTMVHTVVDADGRDESIEIAWRLEA